MEFNSLQPRNILYLLNILLIIKFTAKFIFTLNKNYVLNIMLFFIHFTIYK